MSVSSWSAGGGVSFAFVLVDRDAPSTPTPLWNNPGLQACVVSGQGAPALAGWVAAQGFSDIIVAARRRDERAARLTATVLAGSQPKVAATVVLSDHGTLAIACAAVQALESSANAPAAHDRLVRTLETAESGVMLRRVTRLEAPKPSMWQHLTSMFGRTHRVRLSPRPGVVGKQEALMAPAGGALLISAEQGASGAAELVAGVGAGTPVHPVGEVIPVAQAYKSSGVEYVVFTPAPDPTWARPCPVCGGDVAGDTCPLCHVRLTREPAA